MQTYFMIGTDTDCGKTYVTCQMLRTMADSIAIKPIQSGGTEDVQNLSAAQPHYQATLSRYSFAPPIAPHIAAAQVGEEITFKALDSFCDTHTAKPYRILFIETTGGLMCPLNAQQTWLDYVIHAQKPVIFVVGVRLGCLNHALLTAHALKTHGVTCAGWVANLNSPNMAVVSENLETLKTKLPYKHLATIPFNGTITDPSPLRSLYETRILAD